MLRGGSWKLALLVCLVVPAPALASHAEPLSGQWHLDDSAVSPVGGRTTPDSSGHGLSAAGNTNLALGPGGRFGNHITSSSATLLQAPLSPLLQPQRLTLIAWVRASVPPPTLRYITGLGDDALTCSGSSFAIYTGYPALPGLRFYIRPTDGSAPYSPIASNAVWDGQWHMLAGTYDGASLRFFVDGVEVGTGTPLPNKTINYGFSGKRFYIDNYPIAGCGNADFPGGIDEVRLYDRALNRTEIARMAAAPGPQPPVLVPDRDEDGVGDASDSCPSIPARTADGCPPPVLGRQVNALPASGQVFISVPPGKSARASATVPGLKGRTFVPLTEGRQLPIGSLIDTRKGTVRLISASTKSGQTLSGRFTAGVFQVLQSRKKSSKGLTELRLKGSSFKRCTAKGKRSARAEASRRSRRTVRRLRANAKGRFRTRGRYSAATVRGTEWTTTDRCDGTLTSVKRGKVAVSDFRRHRTILVKRGKRYLARAPG